MLLPALAVICGLILLVWSANWFVEGAAISASYCRVPPLLIGMLVVGFGTSMPEMVVSAFSAAQGNPGLALGNAYGSNITNIALILGLAALISPIAVNSTILRKELPILTLVTAIAAAQLLDGNISRLDAGVLLALFAGLMGWTIYQGLRRSGDGLGRDIAAEMDTRAMPLRRALVFLVVGLLVLVASSRLLVWGAVDIAHSFGVSDLVIGLTVIAVGTSLPELASTLIAARKGEHDLAVGNVLGSNLFNTLAVVGIAGSIHPMPVSPEVLDRDVLVMAALTLSLYLVCYGYRKPGNIDRFEGAGLLLCYLAYTGFLLATALKS
ncbi:calcium/sodium antiporter [Haliea sp. E17]|uniref:calcium/sodium antiporter n=1 Tax=Haliea sp. E17 TaxID=3401576 RepID=UPI003AAE6B47